MARVIYTFTDNAGLTSSVGFDLGAAAAENELMTAIHAVTNCNNTLRTLIEEQTVPQAGAPAAESATVKVGLRVHVTDNVNGRNGYFTIPGVDLDTVTIANDLVDIITAGAGATLATEIEENVVSRDGNAITVNRIERVGRNR